MNYGALFSFIYAINIACLVTKTNHKNTSHLLDYSVLCVSQTFCFFSHYLCTHAHGSWIVFCVSTHTRTLITREWANGKIELNTRLCVKWHETYAWKIYANIFRTFWGLDRTKQRWTSLYYRLNTTKYVWNKTTTTKKHDWLSLIFLCARVMDACIYIYIYVRSIRARWNTLCGRSGSAFQITACLVLCLLQLPIYSRAVCVCGNYSCVRIFFYLFSALLLLCAALWHWLDIYGVFGAQCSRFTMVLERFMEKIFIVLAD